MNEKKSKKGEKDKGKDDDVKSKISKVEEGKKEKKIQWGFLKSPFLPEGSFLVVSMGITLESLPCPCPCYLIFDLVQ